MFTLRMTLVFCLLAPLLLRGEEAFVPRRDFGAPLEVSGKVIHGAGQSNLHEYASLAAELSPDRWPAFLMVYLGVKSDAASMDSRFTQWREWLELLPADVGLQIGLSFTRDGEGKKAQYADAIIAGQYDANLQRLARFIRDLNRPVWVRIGYECNGFWNGYQPETYRPAFQHITKILRKHGGNQVATVWCVHPINEMERLMAFYPGDEWVDWWSIDLFQPKFLNKPVVKAYCERALEHAKPVLIGECAPSEVPRSQQWEKWYRPLFDLIRTQPAIKGFSYINRNWNGSRWDWGDGRVSADPVDMELYRFEMNEPFYHHAARQAPVAFEVEPVALQGRMDAEGRAVIRPGQPARLQMPTPSGASAFSQLKLALRLVDAEGEPLKEGRTEVILRDPKSGRVVASANCKARDYPRTTYLVLEEEEWPKELEVSTSGNPDVGVAISTFHSKGNLEPVLLWAE